MTDTTGLDMYEDSTTQRPAAAGQRRSGTGRQSRWSVGNESFGGSRVSTSVHLGLVVVLGMGLTAAAPSAPPTGSAPDPATVGADQVVTMGAVDPAVAPNDNPPEGEGRTDRFEYLAYYPDVLQVHAGDVVWFERDGFHTVTFSPEGERRGFVRRDEVEGVAAFFGSDVSHTDCGVDDASPCVFTGDEFFNTGWNSMAVTIDAPVGSYTYYCTLHAGMQGTIDVVDDAEPVPTPAEVEAVRSEAIAADTARAEALLEANQAPEFEAAGDHVRWFVKAGDVTDDGRVAILRFMPADLEIGPGDEVEYVAAGPPGPAPGVEEPGSDVHTVTFPDDASANVGLLRYLLPACDPDDPESGAPGIPSSHATLVTGCPPPFVFELHFTPNSWQQPSKPPSGEVFPGTPYDSGLINPEGTPCRVGCDPWTDEPFPSTTRAEFPTDGTFSYVCLVHPSWGMAGAVRVVDQ